MKTRISASGTLVTESGDKLPWVERVMTFESQEQMDQYDRTNPGKKTSLKITDEKGEPCSLKDVSE